MNKTVKAAYALGVNRGQLPRNPAVLSTPPAMAEQLPRWWTPEQVGRFLDFAGSPANSLPEGLVEVLVDSGGRRGEVLALRWEDLDLDAGAATVTRQLVADAGTKVVTPGRRSVRAPSPPSAYTQPRW